MDLHAWITQKVERVEGLAKVATPGPWEGVVDHHQRGEVNASVWSEKLGYYIAETISSGDRHEADAHHIGANDPATVLRRCEADRRILDRHRLATEWTWQHDPACHGCGTSGDCDDPVTDNLNDCPELLDLGYAHGLTDEILAGLDRPTPPERPKREPHPEGFAGMFRDAFTAALTPPITTSDVPEALRGPRWKP